MKRVIFHVGAPKTASTSLQIALSKYEKYLSSLGFFVPRTSKGKHPELAFSSSFDLFNSYYTYTNYLPEDFDDRSSILEHFRTVSRTYIEDFLSSGCHTLILSDELLPYNCNTVDKLQRVLWFFPDSLEVRFLYYTRRPADMYISLYSTLVKVNQTTLWPQHFSLPKDRDKCSDWIVSPEMLNHRDFISNIKIVFGASSIDVFSCSDILQVGDYLSPVDHFFSFLGVDILDNYCDSVSNPRLDYISLFVLSFMNSIARSLRGWELIHACFIFVIREWIIPLLEIFSRVSTFRFPSRHILIERSSFDKLFS